MARLLCVWAALDLCLAGAGIITIVAAICFHRPKQLIINLILDNLYFFGAPDGRDTAWPDGQADLRRRTRPWEWVSTGLCSVCSGGGSRS